MSTERSEPITKEDVLYAMGLIPGDRPPSAEAILKILGRGSKTTILKYRDEICSDSHDMQIDSITRLDRFAQELSNFKNNYDTVIEQLKNDASDNALLNVELSQREQALEKRRYEIDEQIREARIKAKKLKKKNANLKKDLRQMQLAIASLRGELLSNTTDKQRLQRERDSLLDLVPIDERPESLRNKGQEEIEFNL